MADPVSPMKPSNNQGNRELLRGEQNEQQPQHHAQQNTAHTEPAAPPRHDHNGTTAELSLEERSLEGRLREIEQRLCREKVLEDRVQELETKLSVLSRLLKQQTGKNGVAAEKQTLTVTKSPVGPQSFSGNNDKVQQGSDRPVTPPPILLSDPSTSASKQPSTASWSPPRTPREEEEPRHASTPHLESPAAFIAKDRESARLSWRKESARSMFTSSSEEWEERQQQTTTTTPTRGGRDNNNSNNTNKLTTLPIFEDVATVPSPRTSSSIFDAPSEANSNSFCLPESEPPVPKGEGLTHTKRNLSFSLLYGGDEKAYKQGKLSNSAPPAQTSMTMAERRWLGSLAQSINGERQQVPDDNVRHKWLNYLNSFQESTPDVDVQMEEFIKVPGQVEGIMSFGFYICVDSFLYCVTVLPIRFVWSTALLANRLLWKKTSPAFTFHRRHSYQMIQVFILYCVHAYVLAPISIGQLYHWIRGQAMIKLYVLIAIVEVFDRLWCAMGQDCLDSMYWNTVNRPTSTRMIISVVVVLVYCTIHTLFLFVHVATLNVAMNSADQALLALLISGNFAEIKSTVFKKYNRPALFKLTAGDICERFKLGLFLGLVLILNYCQGMERGQFFHFIRTCGMIWGGELLADWIKHSFITKFNFLPARVFVEYALLLAGDVTGIGHEGVNVDNSHAVVKRIGFAQLPFVCVSFRLIVEAAKYAALNEYWQSCSTMTIYGIFAAFWLVLLIVKLALGSLLHHISLAKLKAAPEFMLSPQKKKKH